MPHVSKQNVKDQKTTTEQTLFLIFFSFVHTQVLKSVVAGVKIKTFPLSYRLLFDFYCTGQQQTNQPNDGIAYCLFIVYMNICDLDFSHQEHRVVSHDRHRSDDMSRSLWLAAIVSIELRSPYEIIHQVLFLQLYYHTGIIY